MHTRLRHVPVLGMALRFRRCAVFFFSWLYQDTARINHQEHAVEIAIASLPVGSRVVKPEMLPFGSRVAADHTIDRACIARCFDFANYEAPSQAFRVRALPGNSFVTASNEDSMMMQTGQYTVREQDLPLFELFQLRPSRPG